MPGVHQTGTLHFNSINHSLLKAWIVQPTLIMRPVRVLLNAPLAFPTMFSTSFNAEIATRYLSGE